MKLALNQVSPESEAAKRIIEKTEAIAGRLKARPRGESDRLTMSKPFHASRVARWPNAGLPNEPVHRIDRRKCVATTAAAAAKSQSTPSIS